jgi:5,5'-dehydrodivanillate O-demethylase
MGELMRRYWHPVAGASELDERPTKAVKLLGEELVLYKSLAGTYGLLESHCPHRKASLEYGMPETAGLRCCYHGWLFDERGNCLEQPAEPDYSMFMTKVKARAYPVQELGGLLWAYLGPEPAPLLPRYDLLVDEPGLRDIGVIDLPCNWLQCMENSVDLSHVDHLHGRYFAYVLRQLGRPAIEESNLAYEGRRHEKMAFDVFEHGIIKRRLLEGETEDSPSWKNGTNPVLFPNITTAIGFQIRVPIDDFYAPGDGSPVRAQDRIPVYKVPFLNDDGTFIVDDVTSQDFMVMVTQGPVLDRTSENLGSSDSGVAYYRKILLEQLEKVERGEDPLGVLRNDTYNGRIDLPRGGPNTGLRGRRGAAYLDTHWQRYSPLYDEARSVILRGIESPVGAPSAAGV